MNSLWSLAWTNLRRRQARYGLMMVGAALGVAVAFAVIATAGANQRSLQQTIDGEVGSSSVLVDALGSFDSVLPPGAVGQVTRLPGVAALNPKLSFNGQYVHTTGVAPRFTSVDTYYLGVTGEDLSRAAAVNRYSYQSGGPFGPGPQIDISSGFAREHSLSPGAVIELSTPGGTTNVTVVGILRPEGAGPAGEGNVAYTSLAEAQRLDNRPGAVNAIDVALAPHVAIGPWIQTARADLGQSVSVSPARDAAAGFRSFLAGIDSGFLMISAIAVFVGAFLIYLTFSVAIAERMRVYGTLRALGARPAQVRRMVIGEATVIGLVGGVLGLLIGYLLSLAAVGLTSSLLQLQPEAVGLPVSAAIVGLVLGAGISALAAWGPARRAGAVTPTSVMRGQGDAEAVGAAVTLRRWVTSAVLLLLGILVGAGGLGGALQPLAAPLFLAAVVIVIPGLLGPVAAALGFLTRRLGRGVGDIAVMHLVKQRSRSAYTLGLVMVVVTMVLSIGALNQSMNQTLGRVLDRELGSAQDIQVNAPTAFGPEVQGELTSLPGVVAASPIRFGSLEILTRSGTQGLPLQVVDPSSWFRVAGFVWAQGTDASAQQGLEQGGFLLPETTAQRLGVAPGQSVLFRTTSGLRRLTLAGTYQSIGSGSGVVVGVADLALFGNGRPDAFLVRGRSTAAVPGLVLAVDQALQQRYHPSVSSPAGIRQTAEAQISGFFDIAYALLGLAGLIGLLGLGNTLVVSVLARTREIGVLRASGVVSRQLRRMVMVEGQTLTLVAVALALPLAGILAAVLVVGLRANLGFSLDFVYPWALLVPAIVVCGLVTAAACVVPSRRAARIRVTEALRFE